ncbi:MAG: hypothetical protein H0U91_10710 [Rubrobacter sp.]|nr:hypothetical protein [Rubrobacter sp.]
MTNERWGEGVTVVLHHVPEDEDYEGGYEAVTMTGVPGMVSITATDRDSKEEALSRLLDALRTFGFDGRMIVEDVTELGSNERYEFQAE